MSSHATLKFLGTAIVAAAFSTGAMAQATSSPPTKDGSTPTSNSDSQSSGKTMRKHKAEKNHSSSANPNAKDMKDGPLGTSPGGGNSSGGSSGAGAGAGGAGAAGGGAGGAGAAGGSGGGQ